MGPLVWTRALAGLIWGGEVARAGAVEVSAPAPVDWVRAVPTDDEALLCMWRRERPLRAPWVLAARGCQRHSLTPDGYGWAVGHPRHRLHPLPFQAAGSAVVVGAEVVVVVVAVAVVGVETVLLMTVLVPATALGTTAWTLQWTTRVIQGMMTKMMLAVEGLGMGPPPCVGP